MYVRFSVWSGVDELIHCKSEGAFSGVLDEEEHLSMLVFEETAEAFCFDFGDDLAAGFKQWGVFETKTVYDAFERGFFMIKNYNDLLKKYWTDIATKVDVNLFIFYGAKDSLSEEKINSLLPGILADIFNSLSKAMKIYPKIKESVKDLPRMADFAKWVIAAIPALGVDPNNFLAAYRGNIQDINLLALESAPVAREIMILASELHEGGEWVGTATELLDKLSFDVGETVERRKGWPKSARALGSILSRLAPNFRAVGVNITRDRGSGERLICIRKGKQNYNTPAKHKKRVMVTPLDEGGYRIQMRV